MITSRHRQKGVGKATKQRQRHVVLFTSMRAYASKKMCVRMRWWFFKTLSMAQCRSVEGRFVGYWLERFSLMGLITNYFGPPRPGKQS
ncbi:hypothetical protein GYH30_010150 [Glycine max]|uniref:Uncharacterized protein n=1 Tax=Glycine max TaxID=3847 RepID=A0A0R0KDX4_SOYBN|nr:hypothetical protein JHK87_010287 [Glycine soja]KAG5066688.1 hypothetical protein JHK86_010419 [Glycine max]KAH1111677.1 hypothetical protein GYH30_010150 [Glycine max]